MALKICLKLDEKFVKFENDFTQLGMAMADLQIEYASLRAEITRKDEQFSGQNEQLKNEVAKLKEENRILKCRLMNANNGTGENRFITKITTVDSTLELLSMWPRELDNNELILPNINRGGANNENLVHFPQFSTNVNNIGIAIKQEDENTNNNISPGQSEEQLEIEQQILQHRKQQQNYYLANQMDDSNEVPDGFDQMEEEEEYGSDLPTSSAGYSEMGPLINEPSTSSYNNGLLTNHPRYCCGKIWKHLSDLKRHQASHKPPSIECPHCIQKFTQKSTLFRHIRKFHP